MICRLEKAFQLIENYEPRTMLTVHGLPHTLEKTVNDLQSLSCGSPSLVLGQSVDPL